MVHAHLLCQTGNGLRHVTNGTNGGQTEQTRNKKNAPKTHANLEVEKFRMDPKAFFQGSVCNVCHPGGSFHFQIVMSVDLGLLEGWKAVTGHGSRNRSSVDTCQPGR